MYRQLREIASADCQNLISPGGVGRIAVSTDEGPLVFPVNYVADHGTIVFRTEPFSALGKHCWGDEVAFEVDDLQEETATGWSVLIQGRATPIDDPYDVALIERRGRLRPWAGGSRSLFVRITPRKVSGRYIEGLDPSAPQP